MTSAFDVVVDVDRRARSRPPNSCEVETETRSQRGLGAGVTLFFLPPDRRSCSRDIVRSEKRAVGARCGGSASVFSFSLLPSCEPCPRFFRRIHFGAKLLALAPPPTARSARALAAARRMRPRSVFSRGSGEAKARAEPLPRKAEGQEAREGNAEGESSCWPPSDDDGQGTTSAAPSPSRSRLSRAFSSRFMTVTPLPLSGAGERAARKAVPEAVPAASFGD